MADYKHRCGLNLWSCWILTSQLLPSGLMFLVGPKHPFYVILLIILTLLGFYTTMWITGTSLEEAQEQQWFWSRNELSVQPTSSSEVRKVLVQDFFVSVWHILISMPSVIMLIYTVFRGCYHSGCLPFPSGILEL